MPDVGGANSIIPALRRLRQGPEFESSLNYKARLTTTKKNRKKTEGKNYT
jgi:hypothetical protein